MEYFLKIIQRLLLRWQTRESLRTLGAARSPQWNKLRNQYAKDFPSCAICGSQEDCQVHHCLPFHLYPELELSRENLLMLCREHHLFFGHLKNFSSWNETVREDAAVWNAKIKSRP